ncbi:unnamed protein product [Dibothriocephalus latus]|uniref:Uncharacterized protein n=1 Tax=Dibothriocephalus latus TaxID=60516 RepID=A0A3P6QAM5_DIBLA|nr:unnamed protein product [Dibothriocephalus latus]
MLARAVHCLTCPVKAFTTLTVMSPRRLFGAILLLFIISTASLKRNPSEGDRFNHPRGDFARSTGVTNFRPHFNNFGEHGVARNGSTQRSPDPSFHRGIKSGIGDHTHREPAGKLSGDTNTNKWQYKKFNRESTDKPVVKRAAFAWPERQPFDLRMERRLHPHPHFGHFRNEAIYRFRGPAFHAFEADRMRPDVRGGGPFEEAQIWKWHLGFRGPETGREMRKIPVKGEKDEVEEGRVQEPVEREEERESVQRDVEGSRTWEESREPRGDSPAPSHEDRADERSQEHYSKPLHSW